MAYASHSIKTKVLITAHVIETLNVGGKLAVRVTHDPNSSAGVEVGFRVAPSPHGNGGERVQISDHSQAAYNLSLYVISTGSDASGIYYLLDEDPTSATGLAFSAAAGTGGHIQGSEPKPILGPLRTDGAVGGALIQQGTGPAQKTILVGGGGGGGSAITVQDEGSSLSTAATVLNFVGSGVTASGATGTKTITIPGGAGQDIWQGINAYDDDAGGWQLTSPGQIPTTTTSQLRFAAGSNTRVNLSGTDPLQVNIGFEEKVEVVNDATEIDPETTIAICLSDSHCTAIAETELTKFHVEGNNTQFVNVGADTLRIPRSRYHFLTTGDAVEYRPPDASLTNPGGPQQAAAIGGLSYNTTYYVIKVGSLSDNATSNDRYSPHYIKLATSQSNANAGTEITLTGLGQGPYHAFRITSAAGSPGDYQKYYEWWGGYTTADDDFQNDRNFDYTQYTGLITLPRPAVGKKLTLVIPWRASGVDHMRNVQTIGSGPPLGKSIAGYGALQFVCPQLEDGEGNKQDVFIGNDLLGMNVKLQYNPGGFYVQGPKGITVTGDSFVLCEPEQYRLDYINMLRTFQAEHDFASGDPGVTYWHEQAHDSKKGKLNPPDLGQIVIELVGVPALANSYEPDGDNAYPVTDPGWRPDIPPEFNFIQGTGYPNGTFNNNGFTVPTVGDLNPSVTGLGSAFFPAVWAISTPNQVTQNDTQIPPVQAGIFTDYRTAVGGRGGRGGLTVADARSQYYHILARTYAQRGGT